MITPFLPWSRRPMPEVTAVPSQGAYRPGDPVDVEVSILPQETIYVGQAFLDLVCRETFWYTVTSTGATWVGRYPGHGEENHQGTPYTAAGRPGRYKTSKELVRLSRPFLAERHLFSGTPYRSRVVFRLPEDGPPSVFGDTACLDWQLLTSLSTPGGLDTRLVGRLAVVTSPEQGNANADASPPFDSITESAFEQCALTLSVPKERVTAGQDFEGVLTARIWRDLKVSAVRAVLECREQAGAKESTTTHSLVVLQLQTLLRPGSVYEWRFRLSAPDRLLPSISLDETSVVWRIKGILDRGLRPSLEVQRRIKVCSGDCSLGEPMGPV